MAPLFDNICTLPLSHDIFTQAIHPTLPILAIGLTSGHVQTYRLPPTTTEDESDLELGSDEDSIPQRQPESNGEPHRKRVRISQNLIAGPTPNGYNTHANNKNQSNGDDAILPQSILTQLNRNTGVGLVPGSDAGGNHRRSSAASENGLGAIDSIWSTRRHKGSCRTLTFNHDGSLSYSAGTDGLVKCFDSESGRVTSKIAIPHLDHYHHTDNDGDHDNDVDSPALLHALSPQGLLLGTDSGRLYYYDVRMAGKEMGQKPSQVWRPHGDEHINALVPLPPNESSTSGFPKSWVSVGGTTLAVTDMRKGVMSVSEDQEVELTSVCFVGGLKKGGTSVGEKVCVGQSDGVVSLWERGVWGDLDERIVVDRMEAAVETLVEVPAAEFGHGRGKLKMNEKIVACGLEDGRVRFIRVGRNNVLDDWDLKHDEIDGVVELNFDVGGRMVSGGGMTVKVWTEAKGVPGGGRNGNNVSARQGSDEPPDGEDEGWDNADSSDGGEEKKEKSRKKRKRNNGRDKSGGKAFDFTM